VTVVVSPCADAAVGPSAVDGGDGGAGLEVYQTTNAPWTGITVGVREGTMVYWTSWTAATAGSLSGVMSPPSGDIAVTYTGADLYGSQTTAGSDFWSPASTYVSATVPDAPPGPGLVEINGGPGQIDTIRFSQPVTNPLVGIVSLGTGYLPVPVELDFGAPCTVLSYGPDTYLPTAAGTLTGVDGGVTATEGSGVVEIEGTF
jgi:hypothetical protein